MHWMLMGIDPDLFELSKKIMGDTPSLKGAKKVLSKEERGLLDMIKQYVLER